MEMPAANGISVFGEESIAQTVAPRYTGTARNRIPPIMKEIFKFHDGFLGATKHPYKRVCPSVGPSVRRSVTPSLRRPKKVFRSTLCRVSGLVQIFHRFSPSFIEMKYDFLY